MRWPGSFLPPVPKKQLVFRLADLAVVLPSSRSRLVTEHFAGIPNVDFFHSHGKEAYQRMTILRVIPTMDPRWGGPCRLLRDSTPSLATRGVNVEIACADDPSAEWLHESFPCHGKGPGKYGYSYSAAFYDWVYSNMSRFDAVIVDTLWQWHGLAARLAVERHVQTRGPKTAPALLVMPHGGLNFWYQRDPSRRWKALRNSAYWWAFERKLINMSEAVIFTSPAEAKSSRRTFAGYRPKREFIVNLGISEPPARVDRHVRDFRKMLGDLGCQRDYFLYLNRIHPVKGTDQLIQAYAEAKRMTMNRHKLPRLVIAGPGLETAFGSHILGLVKALGLQGDVFFTGMLQGEQKWGAIYGCNAFVLCSHQESFGIAIVESLACDKPVLITDRVSIWREIETGAAALSLGKTEMSLLLCY